MSDVIDTSETEQPDNSAVEARARETGWVPKDEWRGDPEKWKPAEKYVEFAENNLGLTKKELASANAAIAKLQADMKALLSGMQTRERREYERGLAEAEARRDAAVAAGDVQAFRAAEKDMRNLQKEAQADAPLEPALSPEFKAWQEQNAWYDDDLDMTDWADRMGPRVMKKAGWDGNSIPTKAHWDAVTAAIKGKFPEKFENPRRNVGSGTEGRTAGLSRPRGNGWDDLPPEVRQIAMSSSSLIGKGKAYAFQTREEYAKAYFGNAKD